MLKKHHTSYLSLQTSSAIVRLSYGYRTAIEELSKKDPRKPHRGLDPRSKPLAKEMLKISTITPSLLIEEW